MAKQRKTLPARRQAMDDSLLIRSAESLGRMIGSLQRQLDAARRVVLPANTARGNGHAPGRTRTGTDKAQVKRPAKAAAARASADGIPGRTTKAAMKKKTATKRAGAKRRAAASAKAPAGKAKSKA